MLKNMVYYKNLSEKLQLIKDYYLDSFSEVIIGHLTSEFVSDDEFNWIDVYWGFRNFF